MRLYKADAFLCQQDYRYARKDTVELRNSVQNRRLLEEETLDQASQLCQRGGRVDSCPQVGAVVEPLRIIRTERAEFVDHPAVVVHAGTLLVAHTLVHQEIDVIEQEAAAVLHADLTHRATGGKVGG